MIRLVDLLNGCRDTYLTQVRAGMERDGMPESLVDEAVSQLEAVINDYNESVLRAFGENIMVPSQRVERGKA